MTFLTEKKIDFFSPAPDVSLRYCHWTRKNHPTKATVLIIPGRTEYIEKYHEVAFDLMSRDYDSVILEMRNHGLSTRPLKNRHKHYVESFDDMVRDVDRFIESDVMRAHQRPLLLLAHSMGGHVALRYLAEKKQTPIKAAIFSAPMVGINWGKLPHWLISAFTVLGGMKPFKYFYAPSQGNYGAANRSTRTQRLLTHDRHRFEDEWKHIDKNPDLALGGITLGWLRAAVQSIQKLKSAGYVERIHTPLFIAQGELDRVVDNAAMEDLAVRIKTAEFSVIEGAAHEILCETNDIRLNFWHQVDDFLKKAL